MKNPRELALASYKRAVQSGLEDSILNWFVWKLAYDFAYRDLIEDEKP